MVVKFYNKKKHFYFPGQQIYLVKFGGYVLKIVEIYKVLVFLSKKNRINTLNMDQVLIIAATFLIDVMFFEYN